jgi:hypothetical protein
MASAREAGVGGNCGHTRARESEQGRLKFGDSREQKAKRTMSVCVCVCGGGGGCQETKVGALTSIASICGKELLNPGGWLGL